MTRRIACLHTADSNVDVFEAAYRDLGLDAGSAVLRHEVRSDLLLDAEKAGGLNAEIAKRTESALLGLCDDADVVILTCSTLGPSVASLSGQAVPVLRVDEALAESAVEGGGRVVALCAVETTLEPTRALFERAAQKTGATVEVQFVPGAWTAFRGGDRDRYLALVADAADEAVRQGASRVALAQASMAGAAKLTRTGVPPLTSPAVGLLAALRASAR
jgi:hypothetical protein